MKFSVTSLEKKLSTLRMREEKGVVFLRTASELAWRIRERNGLGAASIAQEVLQITEHSPDTSFLPYTIRALLTVGFCAQQQSRFAEALTFYRRALPLCAQDSDIHGSAEALNGCVAACIKQRDYTTAAHYAQSAHAFIEHLNSAELQGDVFRSLGAVAFVHDTPLHAIEYFTQALACYTKAGAHKKSGVMYFNIGLSYKQLSNYAQALEYLRRSLELALKYKDSENTALSLIRLCSTYTDLGDYANALDTSGRGYDYARKRGIKHIMISALEQRGIAFSSISDYTKALACFEESLHLREQIQDVSGRIITLGNIAAVYTKLGEQEKALQAHQEILRTSEERQDKQGIAAALVNMSEVEIAMGNNSDALRHAQHSLRLFESMGDQRGIGLALQSIGNTYITTQRYTEGMEHFMNALGVFRNTGFLRGQCSVLTAIANAVLDALGKETAASADSAAQWLHDALVIAQEINTKEQIAAIYQSYAAWYEHKGDIHAAFDAFKEYHHREKELRMEEAAKTISILESRLALEESEREAELHRSRAQDLETAVDAKQKELTAMAMQVSQTNSVTEKLRHRLEELAATVNSERLQQELHDIRRELQSSVGTPQLWMSFEQQFQQLHSSFLHTLALRYPALTETERRVCALIKLQLNTKQIASVLNISQRTAEHHRLSIRKKMGVDERGNLGSLLASIE